MQRFVLVAALAVAIGFGTAATAEAQYIIPYGGVTPNGGVVSGDSIYNLGNYQSYNTYISPFGTVKQRAYTTNGFSSFGVVQSYNPYTGLGYSRSFYSPAPGLVVVPPTLTPGYRIPSTVPLGGFNSNPYYRRW